MPKPYDIIIIGAGPAGLNAALHALKSKPSPRVLLVDKKVPWEKPIPCAEGVWVEPLEESLIVKREWIRCFVSNAVLHAPNGTAITYFDKDKGCILNRALMQSDLAAQCAKLGAEMRYGVRVTDVGIDTGESRELRFADGSVAIGRMVIDASGPVSCFGKRENIAWKPADLEPAYFVVAKGADIGTDSIHIYLGAEVAPGGYAWAFPNDNGMANLGIVIGKKFVNDKNDIKKLLDLFLQNNFPNATIVRHFAGTIPCEGSAVPIVTSRLIKTGDAASTVNPVSRAGITEALTSGALAGEFALAMLHAKSAAERQEFCREYQDAWRDKIGKKHGKISRVKNALVRIPDKDYNNAFEELAKIPQDKLSVSKIIAKSLGRSPGLVLAMRHLM